MNAVINQSLRSAAEKVIHRPLSREEVSYLLAGFYLAEGSITDRIVVALAEGTHIPRGLIERAAAKSAGKAGIAAEIEKICDVWLTAA
jgi:hypothetical protein